MVCFGLHLQVFGWDPGLRGEGDDFAWLSQRPGCPHGFVFFDSACLARHLRLLAQTSQYTVQALQAVNPTTLN